MFEHPIFQITIEIVIGFLALLVITRFIRKTQINQITPFDFISAIILGELLGNAVYDENVKIWSIVYAIVLWGILMYIVEKITQRYRKTRRILEGQPSIIIRDGQIDYNVIKKEKLDINELLSILRQKDVFSIREVEYAIFEQSGNISVLKKSKYDNPTTEDMNLPNKPVYLPTSIILDGEVLRDNLKTIGHDEAWLKKEITNFNVKDIQDVFYAEWRKDEGIHVVPR